MPTTVLTGATSGIGLATARLLACRPGVLVLQGPETAHRVEPLLRALQARADPATEVLYLSSDFREPGAVHHLALSVRRLAPTVDVLVNNAGIPGPDQRTIGPWDVELTFGINYLAGVLLTDLLLPVVPSGGRIVNVASATHVSASIQLDDLRFDHRRYTSVAAYAQSKLAVVTHSIRLAGRVRQTVVSIHPGVISTGLLHAMFGGGGSTAEHGAANLAAATTVPASSGSYLDERRVGTPNPIATDAATQDALHETTAVLLDRDIV